MRWLEPRDQLLLAVYCAALLVLLATDLDQKLLPDLITLPLIVFTGAVLLLGWSPRPGRQGARVSSAASPRALVARSSCSSRSDPSRRAGRRRPQARGQHRLMSGIAPLVFGLLVASIGFSVVLLALMPSCAGLSLKSAVPFGPVLILGAFAAVLLA